MEGDADIDLELDWGNSVDGEEKEVVEQLKVLLTDKNSPVKLEMLSPALRNDVFFSRFVRARKKNLEDSFKMLCECILWRHKEKIDSIETWFGQSEKGKMLKEMWPAQDYGFTKEGYPVLVENMVQMDPKVLLKNFAVQDVINHHIRMMEGILKKCSESSERLQKTIHSFVLIESLEGIGMKHVKKVLVNIIKKIIAIDEKYYPELMNKVYVIHAPSFFSGVYSLFSGLIDPVTREKIFVLSKDFLPKVLVTVQKDNLPTSLGGTSKIPWRFGAVEEDSEEFESEEEDEDEKK